MSVRSSTGGTRNKSYSTIDLASTLPPQTQTFEQFRQSRQEKFQQAAADVRAAKEQELHDMQGKIQDLILRINDAQSTLAAEERDYVSEKETLLTEIKRIKIDAEARCAESRMRHLERMEELQQQHENALREFAENMQNMQIPQHDVDEYKEIKEARERLKDAQSRFKNSRFAVSNEEEEEESFEEPNVDACYMNRISELEAQKKELVRTLKDEEATNKKRITEMTMLLDEQETQFHNEIQQLQEEMKKKEETYQANLNKLFSELDRTQVKRAATVEKRKEKIAKIQQQIDETETEFKEKLRHANRVAEKLKAALVNANIRKSQELELERQRSQEQQNMLKESYAIQKNIAKLSKELEKAKKESAYLRRELSAKIGPRRTASLFA